jgi:parallel beta-helix repeat protein
VDPCPGFCDEGVDNTAGHNGVTIEDGSIQEFARGVIVLGANDNRLRHLSAANNTFIGITVGDDSARSRIEGNSITDNGLVGLALFASPRGGTGWSGTGVSGSGEIGLLVEDAAGNRITKNTFSDNVEVGMLIVGDGNQASRNRVLRNGDGMIIVGNDNAITRNHITDAPGCPQDGEVGCGFGISFEGGAGNLIAHNFVTGARNAGIRVAAFEPDTPPAVGTVVRRNLVRAGDVDGILVESTATDSLLEGNIAIEAADDGIDVDSPTTTLTSNLGLRNGDLGIEAVPGVTDGGGNKARGNGNPAQCTNIDCSEPGVRVSVGDQVGEPQRAEASSLTQEHRHGVAEQLAQPAGPQVPGVAGPDPFELIAVGQLADDGLDPAAFAGEPGWWPLLSAAAPTSWSQQPPSLGL